MNKPKYLVIDTKGSKSLSDAVVAFIESATKREISSIYSGRSGREYRFIYFQTGLSGCFSKEARGSIWDSGMDAIKIDAATEMDKLVEFFETGVVIQALAQKHGLYLVDGKIEGDFLTIPGAKIHKAKVKEVYDALTSREVNYPLLAIDTHQNTTLDDIVRKLIARTTGIEISYGPRDPHRYPLLRLDRHRKHLNGVLRATGDMVRVSAATEMLRLIELLSLPSSAITQVDAVAVEDGGHTHDAVISADRKTVIVGCSTVTREKVEEVYKAMFS